MRLTGPQWFVCFCVFSASIVFLEYTEGIFPFPPTSSFSLGGVSRGGEEMSTSVYEEYLKQGGRRNGAPAASSTNTNHVSNDGVFRDEVSAIEQEEYLKQGDGRRNGAPASSTNTNNHVSNGGVFRDEVSAIEKNSEVFGGPLPGDNDQKNIEEHSDVENSSIRGETARGSSGDEVSGGPLPGDNDQKNIEEHSDVENSSIRSETARGSNDGPSGDEVSGGPLPGDNDQKNIEEHSDVENSSIRSETARGSNDGPSGDEVSGGPLPGDNDQKNIEEHSDVENSSIRSETTRGSNDGPSGDSTSVISSGGGDTPPPSPPPPSPIIITDPAMASIPLPLFTEFDVDKAVFDPPENYWGKIKGNITPDRWFVADVGHAYIHGRGFVCNETTEFWFNGRGPPGNAKLLEEDSRRGAESIDHPVFNLLERDTELFEYFPFQSLPLIAVVRSAIVENDGMQVLANDVPHLRTLLPVLLDLPPGRFVWARPNTVYESDKVLVAGYGFSDRTKGQPGRYRSAPQGTCTSIVSEMNHKLTPGFLPADSPERTKVFYVPQAGAGGLVNEEEIIATLREDLAVGLELVVFEPSGNVSKAAEALHHARLLIGPHGGALANMIFLPPDLDVVEFSFLWGPKAHPSYLAASRCMGLRHWTVVPDLDFQGSGEGEAGLVKVSVDDMLDVLQGVGVSRRQPFSGPSKISDPYVAGMPFPVLIEHDMEAAVFNPPDSHPYKNKFITPDRWFVADVGHAYIHGSGFVCNETTEFWFNGRGPPSHAKLLGRYERRGAESIDHPVFNLLEKDSEFFQHFPFQSLPMIAVVKSAIAEMDDVQILVTDLPQLKPIVPLLFDLPPDRFVWAEPRTVYESDKVLVGGYGYSDRTKGLPGRYGSAPQGTCTSIVSEMNQKLTPGFLPADSPERTDVIYLTRGVGNRRSVVNEMEILSFLREELDEKLNLVMFESTGDVRKDAEGLKHARLLIGPHGGAFVNMMFLPVGLDVVEFNMLGGRPCFIASSHCMGLRHWLVEPENEFEYTRGPVEGTWMTVSVEAVRGALDRIGVLRSRDGGSDRNRNLRG